MVTGVAPANQIITRARVGNVVARPGVDDILPGPSKNHVLFAAAVDGDYEVSPGDGCMAPMAPITPAVR